MENQAMENQAMENQAIDNKIKCKEYNGTGYIQDKKNIDEQICYKSGKPCKFNCSGLCKDSY